MVPTVADTTFWGNMTLGKNSHTWRNRKSSRVNGKPKTKLAANA